MPDLGLNLAPPVPYGTELPFADLMHTSGPWVSTTGPGGWGQGPPLPLTPDGYPAYIRPGYEADCSILPTSPGSYPSGVYTVRWDGVGQVTLSSGTVTASGPGFAQVQVDATKGPGWICYPGMPPMFQKQASAAERFDVSPPASGSIPKTIMEAVVDRCAGAGIKAEIRDGSEDLEGKSSTLELHAKSLPAPPGWDALSAFALNAFGLAADTFSAVQSAAHAELDREIAGVEEPKVAESSTACPRGGIPVPPEIAAGIVEMATADGVYCPDGHHLKDGPCRDDYCHCPCPRCRQQCARAPS